MIKRVGGAREVLVVLKAKLDSGPGLRLWAKVERKGSPEVDPRDRCSRVRKEEGLKWGNLCLT